MADRTLLAGHDLVDAIAAFRVAFLREDFKPPVVILLEDHEEGSRFLGYLRNTSTWTVLVGDQRLGKPVEMADGSVFMELEIVGMKVRWPANRYAQPDGTWSYA